MLKRLGASGAPDVYSPCRITPSNFFRFLRGPEYTTIRDVEFVIPVDSMSGQFAQLLSFDRIADGGTFKIKFGDNTTDTLPFNATASNIQEALREFSPLANVLVTGSFMLGFRIIFAGFQTAPELGLIVDNTLVETLEPVVPTWSNIFAPWTEPIRKGDRILDGTRSYSVDETMEMHDLGAQIMAYRCRCD